jgi:hypothetical protein
VRQPKPWFRSSRNAWYVEHRSRQVRLGVHPDGAPPPKKSKAWWNAPQIILDAFYKLMASDPADLPKPDAVLTAQVLDLFLDHSEWHNERPTFLWYKHFLQSFTGMYGRLPAQELRPIHVSRWLDASCARTLSAGNRGPIGNSRRSMPKRMSLFASSAPAV